VQLQDRVIWLLGFPAGFKPNLNVALFFGAFILQLITCWYHVFHAFSKI
jgi:hypothetical protein